QSLHTTVLSHTGEPMEVQIRTQEMHETSEYGVAAHWRYKGGQDGARIDERFTWLRLLMDWQKEVLDAEAFVNTVKGDILQEDVFVFTPRGDVRSLPQGSTPVDFAYRIHTDVGHSCIGAKVNGRMVPLDHRLQKGREMLDKEFRRLRQMSLSGVKEDQLLELAQEFKLPTIDDFVAAIGYGDISARSAVLKFGADEQQTDDDRILGIPLTSTPAPTGTVRVHGHVDMLTTLAHCCKPVAGDAIRGYVTRGKGVTVH